MIQRIRIAPTRIERNVRRTKLGSAPAASPASAGSGAEQRREHDRDEPRAISAIATTAKIEKVYSPAELFAKPIGTKPAIVTSVPDSIGKRSTVGVDGGRSIGSPVIEAAGYFVDRRHRVVDQQAQRNDERAE